MAHHSSNLLSLGFLFAFAHAHSFSYLSLSFYQAAQLTHVLDGQLKELFEDAEKEKALKEVVELTAKEKAKAAETMEKKAVATEMARGLAEKRSADLESKLGKTELRLAEVVSLNTARAEELADLKAALEACENKWYNEGFANTENSVGPIIREARKLAFEEGWLAVLQALGVPEDSPLRDPNQIPFPGPPLPHRTLLVQLTRKSLQA